MSFAFEQIDRLRPLWDRMLDHRFLIGTRDGTLPDETFAVWMRQDYLWEMAAEGEGWPGIEEHAP